MPLLPFGMQMQQHSLSDLAGLFPLRDAYDIPRYRFWDVEIRSFSSNSLYHIP